jgi:hypothetical protein
MLLAEQDLQAARVKAVELELETSFARTRLTRAVGGNAAPEGLEEMP